MKHKKQHILVLLLGLITSVTFSQTKPGKVDLTYFILGTLNDYNGRELYNSVKDRVDDYYSSEINFVHYIDSILTANNISHQALIDTNGNNAIVSKSLAEKMNAFYRFEDARSLINVEGDIFEDVSIGYLKENIFRNDKERHSFLLGVFARNGKINDGTYLLHFANSPSKSEITPNLLKEIGCTDVLVKNGAGVPTVTTISFTPTSELSNLISEYGYQ